MGEISIEAACYTDEEVDEEVIHLVEVFEKRNLTHLSLSQEDKTLLADFLLYMLNDRYEYSTKKITFRPITESSSNPIRTQLKRKGE